MAELEELEQEDFNENILDIPTAQNLPDVPTNPLPTKKNKGIICSLRSILFFFTMTSKVSIKFNFFSTFLSCSFLDINSKLKHLNLMGQ